MGVSTSEKVGCVLGEKEDQEQGDHICFPGCVKKAAFPLQAFRVFPLPRALSLPGLSYASSLFSAGRISK